MNTVIIVNLNGIAFHVEESGVQALRQYLDAARLQLESNPDRDEIMGDLEQAIADKCARYLQSHKNVITGAEIDAVLHEMGPVEGDAGAGTQPGPDQRLRSTGFGPRRLYQIREGAMISGVCSGLAVYFGIDATLVRIVFVILTVLTGGLWLLVYGAMMMLIPFASTDEERAAAAGTPFNAQEVMDRARRHYAQFKDGKAWRAQWRQQRRTWRRHWQEGAGWWRYNLQRNAQQLGASGRYGAQIITGLMIPLLALASAVLFCLFVSSVVTFATHGSLFGVNPFGGAPLWVSLLILCFAYTLLAAPLHQVRRAAYVSRGGPASACAGSGDGLLNTAAFAIVVWVAYRYVPEVRDFLAHFGSNVQLLWSNIVDSFHQSTQAGGAASAAVPPASGN